MWSNLMDISLITHLHITTKIKIYISPSLEEKLSDLDHVQIKNNLLFKRSWVF